MTVSRMIRAALAVVVLAPGNCHAQGLLPQENWHEVKRVSAPVQSRPTRFFRLASGQLLMVQDQQGEKHTYSTDLELLSTVSGGPSFYTGTQVQNGNFVVECQAAHSGLGRASICEMDANVTFVRELVLRSSTMPAPAGTYFSGLLRAVTARSGSVYLLDGADKVIVLNADLTYRSEFSGPSVPPLGIDGLEGMATDPVTDQLLLFNIQGSGLTLFRYSDAGDLLGSVSVPNPYGLQGGSREVSRMGGRLVYFGTQTFNSGFAAQPADGSRVQFVTMRSDGVPSGFATSPAENLVATWPLELGDDLFAGEIGVRGGTQFASLVKFRRTYRSPSIGGPAIPVPHFIGTTGRPGQSLLDIDFRVDDADSASVTVGLLALAPGSRSLTGAVRPAALVEGTQVNVGNGVATGEARRVTWDAGTDLGGSGFRQFDFSVFANDGRALIDLHFARLPPGIPGVADPELFISTGPVQSAELLEAWLWLVAVADTGIIFDSSNGTVVGSPTSAFPGQLLASVTTTTAQGRQFLWDRLAVCEATQAEIDRARIGTTPGVQQYIPEKRVGVLLNRVNEIGVDTGTLTGHWVRMRVGPSCS